ncbi:hypothetical protein J6590_031282 [Homalodisca vitripennis]|nr:hypothetical protein J6590_031282 [Homalodisca vitripennis]
MSRGGRRGRDTSLCLQNALLPLPMPRPTNLVSYARGNMMCIQPQVAQLLCPFGKHLISRVIAWYTVNGILLATDTTNGVLVSHPGVLVDSDIR